MASGVEVRVPFLDLDLVEFASRIPSQYKQSAVEKVKWVLKKAMEPYLPHDVIYRPKSGFCVPLRRWLHELHGWLRDTLSSERLRSRGSFDPLAVQRLIEANEEGKFDASYTPLSLACIEIWCRHFIDCPVRSRLPLSDP